MKKNTILFLFLFVSYSLSAQLNNGLLAKYYFNNSNTNDDFGNVHGVNHNASLTTDRFGCPNRAYKFNPADTSFIGLGDNFDNAFTGSTGLFSISIWFRRTDLTYNNSFLITKHGNSYCGENGRQFLLRISENNKLDFTYHTSLGIFTYRYATGSTTIMDTLWHHAVINYNASQNGNNGLNRVQLYLDGVAETMNLTGTYGTLAPIQNGAGHLTIGSCTGSTGDYCGPSTDTSYAFDGDLDDIRIYNRLLTLSEIQQLFNEEYGCNTSIAEIIDEKKEVFKIYPNPTSLTLSIELLENLQGEYSLELYNNQGQLLQNISNINEQKVYVYDVSSLPNGMYYAILRDRKGIILQNEKFIKS